MNPWPAYPHDIFVLHELLQRKRKLAEDPLMTERAALWKGHASPNSRRPMILAETGGVVDELVPLSNLRCREEWARRMERDLREQIFRTEQVQDDWVLRPFIGYQWFVNIGNFGVPLELVMKDVHTLNDQPERLGRWVTLAREECEKMG